MTCVIAEVSRDGECGGLDQAIMSDGSFDEGPPQDLGYELAGPLSFY